MNSISNWKKKALSIAMSMAITCTLIPIGGMSASARKNGTANFNRNYTLSGDGASDLVAIAKAQVGKNGGSLGYETSKTNTGNSSTGEEWCADFVSDCAILAGQSAAIPANAGCSGMYDAIIKAGGNDVSAANAMPGDILFYNNFDHVEIVYAQKGKTLWTLSTYGGNSGDRRNYYSQVKNHTSQSSPTPYKVVRPNYKKVKKILPGTKSNEYKVPVTIKATKKINTYDEYGNIESGRYIANDDSCYITEVYTNGFVKVRYPIKNGTRWSYAKSSDFALTKIINDDNKKTFSFPSLSTSKYMKCYAISNNRNISVYASKDLSSPEKNRYIYGDTDELYVYSIGKNSKGKYYAYISYPTSSERRKTYVPLSVITSQTTPKSIKTATMSITTYKKATTKNTYGTIDTKDKIYVLEASGSFTRVIYPLTNSKGTITGYKMAYVKTTDLNNKSK